MQDWSMIISWNNEGSNKHWEEKEEAIMRKDREES